MIAKYYPYFPLWVLVELISFGDLLHLASFYDEIYGTDIVLNNKFMNTIRGLRNAAAHSNCLMNKMTETLDKTKQPDSAITNFVKNLEGISKNRRAKYMNMTFTYNLVTLLYVYDHYIPVDVKRNKYKKILEFMNGRAIENREFFCTNGKIQGVYDFLLDIIDKLISK